MPRPIPLVSALLLSAGCIVYDDGPDADVGNSAPVITFAEAGCEWDPAYGDYVWWFDADVGDNDGPWDVTAVWAMVYYPDGVAADYEFLLDPVDPPMWSSAWQERSTSLACGYYSYFVEIYAEDSYGATDAVSVTPYQYP